MALIQATWPLCRELRRLLPSRPFNVRFWDGGVVEATTLDAPTFFVRRPSALSHFLRAPRIASASVAPTWMARSTVDDLDAAFIVVDEWEPPALSGAERVRLGLAIVAAAAPGGFPRRPSSGADPARASFTASSATRPRSATTTTSATSSLRCSSTSR